MYPKSAPEFGLDTEALSNNPSCDESMATVSSATAVCFKVNPLNPNIKIQILICCPYMFSIEAVDTICLSIN